MKRSWVISLSLVPSLLLGCGNDSADPGGGPLGNNGYGKDSGGDSSYDAPTSPDAQGLPDGAKCTPEACDDGNPCTQDACDPAVGCSYDSVPMDGQACGTSDACNTFACSNGSCIGTETVCEDDDPCTVDSCDPASGCVFDGTAAEGESCDDGNACTTGDVCTQGTCSGTTVACDDDNPCTEDSCDTAIGCVNDPGPLNGSDCDDSSVCTENDVCTNGLCKGAVIPCHDTNDCTVDVCDPVTGCSFDAAAADGMSCNDGDMCTTNDSCQAGVCAGSAATCNDGNPCTADSCDSALGCVFDPTGFDGQPCDDGNVCTSADSCTNGICTGGAIDCADTNPCTVDTCDAVAGCQHLAGPADGATCDDGDLCTVSDTCSAGICVGGTPLYCSDGNDCTQDGCDPTSGCTHNPAPLNGTSCNDESACTQGDSCTNGSCVGTSITCDDGEFCTVDSCDPNTGCVFDATAQNGQPCDDQSLCTQSDVCNAGTCKGAAIDCNDGIYCTQDSCDPLTGCAYAAGPMDGVPCNDQDQCTTGDLCSGGACQGTPGADLEDNDGTWGDGVPDVCDNCPAGSTPQDFNPNQEDTDGVRAEALANFAAEDMSGATTIDFPPQGMFVSLPMPFAFTMFGTTYDVDTPLFVHRNALLTFGSEDTCDEYEPIMPCSDQQFGAADMIALAWSPAVHWGGTVTYDVFGSPGSRRLVVDYEVPFGNATSPPPIMKVQAVLYEGSNDIVINTTTLPGGDMYVRVTRGVGHNDILADPDDQAIGAWIEGEFDATFSLTNSSVRYTTGAAPDGVGDACANRWLGFAPMCMDLCMGYPDGTLTP